MLNGLYSLKNLKELECYSNSLGTLEGIEKLPNLKLIKCNSKFDKMPLELLRLQNSGFKRKGNYTIYTNWIR